MYCPHTILINNSWFYLVIHTSSDYIYTSHIPKKEWFQLWRYEFIFWRHTTNMHQVYFHWNDDCRKGLQFANALYKVKTRIKCFFGFHDDLLGKGECFHCGKDLK